MPARTTFDVADSATNAAERALDHADRPGDIGDAALLVELHRDCFTLELGGYFDGRRVLFLLNIDLLLYEVSAQRGDEYDTLMKAFFESGVPTMNVERLRHLNAERWDRI